MIRKTVVQGAVILAATAAAALAACSSDTTTPDDSGGEGDGSGGTANTGGSTTGGANSGGANTGGTTTGGTGGALGGGGQGGEGGGSTPLTAEDLVDEYCPDGSYTIVEGTEGADSYGEISISSDTAYVLWGDVDQITFDGASDSSQPEACLLGGDEGDTFVLRGSAGGVSGEYTGNVPSYTVVGGDGLDTLNYVTTSTSNYSSDYRPPFRFVDFESGGDQIIFHAGNVKVNATLGTDGVEFVSGFTAGTAAEYASTTDYALIVDPTDGEIWLSHNAEGSTYNFLIGIVEGDTLQATDVVVDSD